MIQKKIINILIGASIILLLSNVIFDFFDKKNNKINSGEITVSKIDSVFFSVINKFALKEEWIKKKNIKNTKTDSLKYVFELKIPADIPIAAILKEMNYGFNEYPVEITSEEKINFGKTVLKIYSNEHLKLQAVLNIEKEIAREYSRLSFILTDAGDLNEEDFTKLMRFPYPFALLLLPEEKTFNLLSKIYEYRKEVFLLLNDDVDEKKYSLDPDYEKIRLKTSVLAIRSDFPKIINYIVDNESDLYAAPSFNYIKDEFQKREIKIAVIKNFVNLDRDTENEIISLIQFYAESGKSKEPQTYLISAENFMGLERALSILFNKGTRYPLPSEVN